MSNRRWLAAFLAVGFVFAIPTRAISDDSPSDLTGTWTWSWKDADDVTHRHLLELEGKGDSFKGKERFDDEAAVKVDALKQEGKTISFAVDRDGRHAEYKGKLTSSDLIDGVVTVTENGMSKEYDWTASRQKDKK
ncbi:hypothetical protein P12x_001828 [Tundrisphaera lichenicola]|uniref:hypothetical protein n=1 Tax=Tundrisphaera lichenicola TaxID=2029860 RepID=UPI003EC0F36A